jgi:acyl-CoA synthetase (AMP-forming)/AMP-acid ligase II
VINPINVMLTPAEVAYVTKDCGAKALIGSPDKTAPSNRLLRDELRPSICPSASELIYLIGMH